MILLDDKQLAVGVLKSELDIAGVLQLPSSSRLVSFYSGNEPL